MSDKQNNSATETQSDVTKRVPTTPKERVWREIRPSGAANALQQLVHTAQEFESAVWNGHVSSPDPASHTHEA